MQYAYSRSIDTQYRLFHKFTCKIPHEKYVGVGTKRRIIILQTLDFSLLNLVDILLPKRTFAPHVIKTNQKCFIDRSVKRKLKSEFSACCLVCGVCGWDALHCVEKMLLLGAYNSICSCAAYIIPPTH